MLRVLRSRNYRLFWSGSFIANLGVWVQQIALGWLVYDMTRKASLLGTVSFCGNMPVLALGLVGGAIADRATARHHARQAQRDRDDGARALAAHRNRPHRGVAHRRDLLRGATERMAWWEMRGRCAGSVRVGRCAIIRDVLLGTLARLRFRTFAQGEAR